MTGMPAVMTREGKLKEAIFALRALADVVDDPGRGAAIGRRDDQSDVRELSGDGAGDEIAGKVVGAVLRDGQRGSLTLEEDL